MEHIVEQTVEYTLRSIPYFSVTIAGIVMASARRRTHPRVFYLSCGGFTLLLILRVLAIAATVLSYIGNGLNSPLEYPFFRFYWQHGYFLLMILTGTAYFLLLMAVFAERDETTQQI
jgi:hypothetical protein